MTIPLPQENRYRKRPKLAFQESYYKRGRIKRHYHQRYARYYYALPAICSSAVCFLKQYFKKLDSYYNLPHERRIRQTEYDYADFSVIALHHILCRIEARNPILVGSMRVSPCPWAVFGPSIGVTNKLIRNRFPSMADIFQHYNEYIWNNGFNVMAIDRPIEFKSKIDPIEILSEKYCKSSNFILAVSILLLCDLVKNCGPDSEEFRPLFTNDKKEENPNIEIWKSVIDELSDLDFDKERAKCLKNRSNNINLLGLFSRSGKKYVYSSDPYFDVEIRDVTVSSHFNLIQNEKKVDFYGNLNNSELLLLTYDP